MNTRHFHIGLVLWIAALVAGGYAEPYPNRPTASELDEIVALGTECVPAPV